MQGKWVYIGGGAALLVAGIVATRSHNSDQLNAEASPPAIAAETAAETAAPPPVAAPAAAPAAPADDPELLRLAAALADREKEVADLRTTLTIRDTLIASLQGDVARGDAATADLQARLAASEAEVAALREQLARLTRAALPDAKLAIFNGSDDDPSAARLVSAAAQGGDLGAAPGLAFAAKTAPAPVETGSVSIHFEFASARLTPGAEAHATAAAALVTPVTRVRLVGHTDRVGGAKANRRLAAKRAARVADFLVAAGVPRELIVVDEADEGDLPVATAAGVAEPLNRSVEISLLPL